MFFTLKLPILVNRLTKDKPIYSNIRPDYSLFNVLFRNLRDARP